MIQQDKDTLPQAKKRNRSHPCFSRVVVQPRKKRKKKRDNKVHLASQTVPPPAAAVNSEEVPALENVFDLVGSDDEPKGVSTMDDGSAVLCKVNGAKPNEPCKGGDDILRCNLSARHDDSRICCSCLSKCACKTILSFGSAPSQYRCLDTLAAYMELGSC